MNFFLKKISNFELQKKKTAAMRFDFLYQLMIETFLTKLDQFEETGLKSKTFISLRNLETKFHFQN